jgi:hypothetical protein
MNGTFTSYVAMLMMPAGQAVQQRTICRSKAGNFRQASLDHRQAYRAACGRGGAAAGRTQSWWVSPTMWPWGSAISANATPGTCWGSWMTRPPSSAARFTALSTSSTATKNVTRSLPPCSGLMKPWRCGQAASHAGLDGGDFIAAAGRPVLDSRYMPDMTAHRGPGPA